MQYSIIGSSGYWAQLGWQPFSAWLIVKVPTRYLMSFIVTAWGLSMVGLAFSTNFKSLLAFRFLLGLFEASCLPLFTMVTVSWYRRSEQPLRVALWYGTNGVSTMLGSFLAWALSFATGAKLHVYQILFLVVGLATVITGPSESRPASVLSPSRAVAHARHPCSLSSHLLATRQLPR